MAGNDKYNQLIHWFTDKRNAAIAFSGGVDSTFVLAIAQKMLGHNVLALTVKTPYIPDWEVEEAVEFCRKNNILHKVIHTGILPEIKKNPQNRCYLCKQYLFALLKDEALKKGIEIVLDGSNADDSGIYRPGLAALKELGIRSPLLETGISKKEVRAFSSELGLPTAEKPSYACLLTRLPYDYKVTSLELLRVEKAERYLNALGYGNSRVRNHGDIARIELEKDRISEFVNSSKVQQVTTFFHELGYKFIAVDIEGYRSGSFDTTIQHSKI